jgi:hypothetical protein
MLEALVRQDDLEEFWGEPDFLESGCTTTKQHNQCIEWNVEPQGHVRWFLGHAGIQPEQLLRGPSLDHSSSTSASPRVSGRLGVYHRISCGDGNTSGAEPSGISIGDVPTERLHSMSTAAVVTSLRIHNLLAAL